MKQLTHFIKMLVIALALIAFAILAARAETVTNYQFVTQFMWDHSPSTNVVGYNVYCGPQSHVYTSQSNFGYVTNGAVTVGSGTWFFAATAKAGDGQESPFSNEVSVSYPTPPPQPPVNLLVLSAIVQASTNLTNWMNVTNIPLIYVGSTNGTAYYRASLVLVSGSSTGGK